jgi:dTDP-4-dehydrorhamnose reductase
MLAADLAPALAARGFAVAPVTRAACDITDPAAVRDTLGRLRPGLVVNCAAYTQVDRAESDTAAAFAVNADGAGHVARAAAAVGCALIHVSTDYVFDGGLRRPYQEDDAPAPLGVYARSKWEGERQVMAAGGRATVVRTGELYGDGGRNFFSTIIGRARAGAPLRVVDDQVVSPTWTRELGAQIALIAAAAPPGLYHATASGEVSWFDAAREALAAVGLAAQVEPVSTAAFGSPTPRPPYSVLGHAALERLGLYRMGPWREALRTWLRAGAA